MEKFLKILQRGLPALINDLRAIVSANTPFFIAVPRSIYVDFGSRCNAFCNMCRIGLDNQAGRSQTGPELSEELAIKLLKEVRSLSGRGVIVSLTGGEPLLYKPLYKMMQTAKDLGVLFSFTTNGYLLSEETVQKIAHADPFGIGISIESLDPSVNEILRPYKNGEGTRLAVQGIELLLKARRELKKSFRINIKTVISKVNMASFPEIIRRFGKESGVMITPQPYLHPGGVPEEIKGRYWIDDIPALTAMVNEVIALKQQGYNVRASDDTLRGFIRYFQPGPQGSEVCDPKRKRAPCLIGYTTIFVNGTGEIKLCPYMKRIGDLAGDKSLKEMWLGKEAKDLRRAIARCVQDCELSCTRNTSLWERFLVFLKST